MRRAPASHSTQLELPARLEHVVVDDVHWPWFGRTDAKQRSSVLRVLDKLGKWSMLDVFIVAVLVVALKLGPLAEVTIEPGFYYFGAAVILSMLIGARIEKLARDLGDRSLDD